MMTHNEFIKHSQNMAIGRFKNKNKFGHPDFNDMPILDGF
jgi:hypothetical protein